MKNMDWNKVFIFVAGAAIGSVVTWKVVKDKYEKTIKEIISVIEEDDSEDETVDIPEYGFEAIERARKLNLKEYASMIAEQNYAQNEEVLDVERPYIITPEEFGECDGYGVVSLYYHADGVLTDTQNEIIDYVDDVVGLDAFNHFGEYEDDSVFVRNDKLKTDYEILRTEDKYSDIVGAEDE